MPLGKIPTPRLGVAQDRLRLFTSGTIPYRDRLRLFTERTIPTPRLGVAQDGPPAAGGGGVHH